MGIGDSWGTREELLHPRDKNGRFRSKWKMASGVVNAILRALGSFNPRTFSSDGEAGQYLFNHAKPSRFRGGSDFRALTGFAQANKNLRAGSVDPETKKFVQVMDESSVNLPDDVILSKVVGPQAFGLTPETVGLDDGGIEDFTGKLIGDRGYNSAMIGTPGRKQPGQIEMRIAVPKGTKAVIPATSRGDREVILDKDQELRVTKVTPDGQGGFYVLAVAQPRTPGATPEPVGSPAPAPGAPQAPGVPGDVQSDNAPDPRAMVQQPGAPPPRTEPEVTPSLGGGPAPAGAPGPSVAPDQGAPGAPALDVPALPATPRIVDLRAAVREAQLPIPSRGKRRRDWDQAYYKLASPKPANPDDVLRELDKDIEVHRREMADLAQGGDSDPLLADDVAALEGLQDLIREKYDLPAPARAPEPAPVKKAAPAKVAPVKKAAPAAPRAQIAKKATPAKATPVRKVAPEAPAAPGDDLDKMLKNELVQEARKVGVSNPTSMNKAQLKDAIRAGRGKPETPAVNASDIDAARALPQVPKSRVQDGDTVLWQPPNDKAVIGRVVDKGPRRRFVDWGGGRRERLALIQTEPHITFHREGAAPAPVKKAAPAPAKAAKAAVPGAAPGTAAGKITATRLTPGTRLLVADSSGIWVPTNRKTGSVSVEVTAVERVQGGTTPGGRGTSRARIRITARDGDGNEKQINASPSQTFLVQESSPAGAVPPAAAPPRDEGVAVNMRRPLRRTERNEMISIIDQLIADGTNVPGFQDQQAGRGSVKDILETLREELQGSKKVTPDEVNLLTGNIFARLGLGLTTNIFDKNKSRDDIQLRDLLASRLPAITEVATGIRTPAVKAARTKVDGPKATTPVLAPDRKKTFRDAVTEMELNLGTDSVGRQTNEIFDEIEAGKLTPEEGIRRLETEISMNKEEVADLDRAIREETNRELKRIGIERRKRFADSVAEQERGSVALRKFFNKEPAVTTDEVVINLPPEDQEALNNATLAELKKAAEGLGIKATGRTKKQFLDAVIKKLAENEMERRGITKVPAPAKAPSKPKPTPAGAKYERIDLRALAEGLPIDTEQDKRIFDRFQKQLDDEKQTPPKIADEIIGTARQAFFWPAVVNQQVSHKDIRPGLSETEIVDINARNVEVRAETDRLKAKGQAWLDLAERLRKVRRKKAGSMPPDAPEPKLSAPEKAEIEQVAELTDIPAETLAKKALAKKKADAPAPRTAQQVADTLATVNSADEANTILKGHTKAELLDIAKVMDIPVPSGDTKPKIVAAISDRVTVGSAFKVLARGGFRNDAPAPSGGALTRARLQEMTIPEIKALEDELGIKRTSVARTDRIDAILKAQGAAPAPKKAAAPVEAPEVELARKRQADIDQARKIGNVAGEWSEILSHDASQEALLARLRGAETREGVDLSRVIQSVENGDMEQARTRMEQLVDNAGLTRQGTAGKIQQYTAKEQLLPGDMVGPSGRVRVLRPGYTLKRGDELITLSRPIVIPLDDDEVDVPAPDVDRPKKGLQAGATKATEIKVPAGFEAWFRDGRKKNIVIYDKDRNPVASVGTISVEVPEDEGGTGDREERFFGGIWGKPNLSTSPFRTQQDAVKGVLELHGRQGAAPKLSTKPILENTWGGRRSEIHFHADGAIGMGLKGLKGDDRRLEVDGDALENVIGRIATDLVTGEITGDEQIDRLRNVAAGLPDGPAKRAVSRMVSDLDAPRPLRPIKVPDAGQYTGVLQELMNKLLQIPLARGGSRVNRQDFNEADLLLDYIKELRTTRPPSILAEDLRRKLWNKRHESMEGKLAIDRAIEAAIKEMKDMKRQPS